MGGDIPIHLIPTDVDSRDNDPSLLVGWAGWKAVELCQAVAGYRAEVIEQEGWLPVHMIPHGGIQMTFLTSFQVVHYRGIDGLSLPALTRANLVTGVNGVGKTALLEAM